MNKITTSTGAKPVNAWNGIQELVQLAMGIPQFALPNQNQYQILNIGILDIDTEPCFLLSSPIGLFSPSVFLCTLHSFHNNYLNLAFSSSSAPGSRQLVWIA